MKPSRPASTRDLTSSERHFVTVVQRLGYCALERVPIRHGELVLNPWPTTLRKVRFGSTHSAAADSRPAEFDLKKQLADFFEHVRGVQIGEIRVLHIQGGLPTSMEIEDDRELSGDVAHG